MFTCAHRGHGICVKKLAHTEGRKNHIAARRLRVAKSRFPGGLAWHPAWSPVWKNAARLVDGGCQFVVHGATRVRTSSGGRILEGSSRIRRQSGDDGGSGVRDASRLSQPEAPSGEPIPPDWTLLWVLSDGIREVGWVLWVLSGGRESSAQ